MDLPRWLFERVSNFSFSVSPAENSFSNKLNERISDFISPPLIYIPRNWLKKFQPDLKILWWF
jgi:hypothetical protein